MEENNKINIETPKTINKEIFKKMYSKKFSNAAVSRKESIKTLMTSTVDSYPHKKEIEKSEKDLIDKIENLGDTIEALLESHHRDYATSFAQFMDKVRKDLKLKIKEMEKIQEAKEKLNDINTLKCERDYFRAESIRLNAICINLKSKIDDMSIKMKILSDEVNNLSEKWKDSEVSNRQLFVELEENIQKQHYIMKELSESRELLDKANKEQKDYQDIKFADDEEKEKMAITIQKLKNELKKEKYENRLRQTEYNKVFIEENQLQKIFLNCIESAKKAVVKRKQVERVRSHNVNGNLYDDEVVSVDMFLPEDKMKILEDFLFNDEVKNIISENLFTKNLESKKIVEQRSKKLSGISLPDIDKIDINKKGNKTTMSDFNQKNKKFKGIPVNLLTDDSAGNPFFKTMGRMNTTNYTNYTSKNITEEDFRFKKKNFI